jgi:hypothetical protein
MVRSCSRRSFHAATHCAMRKPHASQKAESNRWPFCITSRCRPPASASAPRSCADHHTSRAVRDVLPAGEGVRQRSVGFRNWAVRHHPSAHASTHAGGDPRIAQRCSTAQLLGWPGPQGGYLAGTLVMPRGAPLLHCWAGPVLRVGTWLAQRMGRATAATAACAATATALRGSVGAVVLGGGARDSSCSPRREEPDAAAPPCGNEATLRRTGGA